MWRDAEGSETLTVVSVSEVEICEVVDSDVLVSVSEDVVCSLFGRKDGERADR